MSILFPLVLVPTFQSSGGDEVIFYSTVAGILFGSVAGDHMSPISDTTVLHEYLLGACRFGFWVLRSGRLLESCHGFLSGFEFSLLAFRMESSRIDGLSSVGA